MNEEILFKRIKNIALHKPHKSPQYIAFLKEKYQYQGDFHHVFGSLGSLKSTDLLGVIVSHDEHMRGESDREWIIEQLPQAIKNLIDYVVYLEQKKEK